MFVMFELQIMFFFGGGKRVRSPPPSLFLKKLRDVNTSCCAYKMNWEILHARARIGFKDCRARVRIPVSLLPPTPTPPLCPPCSVICGSIAPLCPHLPFPPFLKMAINYYIDITINFHIFHRTFILILFVLGFFVRSVNFYMFWV